MLNYSVVSNGATRDQLLESPTRRVTWTYSSSIHSRHYQISTYLADSLTRNYRRSYPTKVLGRFPPCPAPFNSHHSGSSCPMSRQETSYNRRRAGGACSVCRARKTKCDNRRPICGFCVATGGSCVYPGDLVSDHSRLDKASLAILQRLGEVEQNLAALISGDHPTVATSSPQSVRPDPNLANESQPHGNDPMPRVPRAVEPDSNRPPSADVITWSSEMKVESLLRWPVFGIQNYPSLTASLGSKDAEAPTQAGNGMFDLDAEVITGLVGNFLSINHVKNPIFDIDLLWSYVRAIAETGLRWDGPSCLVVC